MEYNYYKSSLLNKLDRLGLRFGRDTLDLYHSLTGKGKHKLAVLLVWSAALFEFTHFSMESMFAFMDGKYVVTSLTIFCCCMYPICSLVTSKGFALTIKIEKLAEEAQAIVPPVLYRFDARSSMLWGTLALFYCALTTLDFDQGGQAVLIHLPVVRSGFDTGITANAFATFV